MGEGRVKQSLPLCGLLIEEAIVVPARGSADGVMVGIACLNDGISNFQPSDESGEILVGPLCRAEVGNRKERVDAHRRHKPQ